MVWLLVLSLAHADTLMTPYKLCLDQAHDRRKAMVMAACDRVDSGDDDDQGDDKRMCGGYADVIQIQKEVDRCKALALEAL